MFTTILGFFTGSNTKFIIYSVIAGLFLICFTIISYQEHKIDDMKIEISTLTNEDARKRETIGGLISQIDRQNSAIEKIKLDMINASKEYSEVAPKIITKYKTIVDKNASCDQQLGAINAIIDTFNGGKK